MALLLATALAFLLLLATAWHWARAASPRARLRRRVRGLAVPAAPAAGEGGDVGMRRQLIQGKLRELERQRKRSRSDTLLHLLLQSGLPLAVRHYVAGSAAVAAALAGTAWLLGLPAPACALAGLGGGLFLPRLALRHLVARRQKAFVAHFADALDILVRGTRSGLPVGACLRIVAQESPEPVGPEFALLCEGERLGMTLKQSLARGVERMPVAELRFFAIVLQIQQQTGGNLAGTLDKLAALLRARKRLRDKVRAVSAEAKSSAMIIGALPFLVAGALALVNPGYIGLLFTDRLGTVLLVGALAWMGVGILVMRNMINFDM